MTAPSILIDGPYMLWKNYETGIPVLPYNFSFLRQYDLVQVLWV